MKEEIPKAVIKINPNDFLIPFERALVECSNAVYIGLSVLENLNELPEYLHGEDDFMIHTPYGLELQIEQRKTMYREWLIKKGFEDLIKSITLMFVDICKVLSINSKLKGKKTWEEFIKIINSPEDEITAKHYPDLLNIIKSNLKEDLLFDKEITSINKVRNCLVHRNGIVSSKDFFKGDLTLKLHWLYFKAVYILDEKEEEINRMMLITGRGRIELRQETKIKEFQRNDKIEISYQIFNELIITCQRFAYDLIAKLKIGE